MKQSIFIALLLIAASCGSNSSTKHTGVSTDTTHLTNGAETEPIPATGDFYKAYTGTIAGQPVVLHLHRFDSNYHASYYYIKQGRVIDLYVQKDTPAANSLVVSEAPALREDNDGPAWNIRVDGDIITGTWKSPDGNKTYPISLQEDAAARKLTVYKHAKSIPFREGREKPAAYSATILLLPDEHTDKDTRSFLQKELLKTTGCKTEDMQALNTCLDEQDKKYAAEYRNMVADMGDSTLDRASNNHYSMNFMNVVFDGSGLLVLQVTGESYTGGAHGMYGSGFINIDIRNQRVIELEDVMIVDTLRLATVLDREARKYFGIAPSAKISSRLFVEQVKPNGNFFLTNTGITFNYTPYEIASYADGEIRLFIPYKAITDILKSGFRERMHL